MFFLNTHLAGKPAVKLICCALLALCLGSCKPGFENTDSGNSDDDDNDGDASSISFIGTGAGSSWLLDIVDNDSFDLALKTRPGGTLVMSVGGTYEDLSSDFSRLQVSSANGTDAPALDSYLPALRLANQLLLLQHWNTSGDLIPFIPDTDCPTLDFTANWIQLIAPGGSQANDADTPFLGTMDYDLDNEQIVIDERYALTEDFPDLGAAEDLPTGTCDGGFAREDDDHFFFADNGTALVHRNIDSNDESLWLALPSATISVSELDGSYIGFWIDNARVGSERLWNVTMECTAGSCPVERITDIADLNSLANERFQIELDEDAIDPPRQGFVAGTTEVSIGIITDTGHLVCIASDDFNDTGDKLLACVGQSPSNPQLTVNGFFIAED